MKSRHIVALMFIATFVLAMLPDNAQALGRRHHRRARARCNTCCCTPHVVSSCGDTSVAPAVDADEGDATMEEPAQPTPADMKPELGDENLPEQPSPSDIPPAADESPMDLPMDAPMSDAPMPEAPMDTPMEDDAAPPAEVEDESTETSLEFDDLFRGLPNEAQDEPAEGLNE